MVIRKSDTNGGLNDRLGKTLKDKKLARFRTDLRYVLMGLLLILALAVAVVLLLVPA